MPTAADMRRLSQALTVAALLSAARAASYLSVSVGEDFTCALSDDGSAQCVPPAPQCK